MTTTTKPEPQVVKILRHLRREGSISPAEALFCYGVQRLAARIQDLLNAGYVITPELKRDPHGKPYARYYLSR